MRVLLAFDKFKDSLTAREACEIAAHALRERGDLTLDLCPLADGGEGFCDILTRASGGQIVASTVRGPLGEPVQAILGLIAANQVPAAARGLLQLAPGPKESTVAVVEMAAASGLALLEPEERDPWLTSTFGTGELIRTAAELGASAIVLGVGGSATNDLGLGALAALGVEFLAADDEPVDPPVPADWPGIAQLAGKISPPLPPVRIACDVTNPLLGARGAAAVYGPQKGLRAEDLARLDHASARMAMMLCAHCGKPDAMMETPGAGAAGGISFGLMVAADARLVPGFDLVSAWLDLDARLAAADLVLTGEGRFDASSLEGKGPGAIVKRALEHGKPVHVFAGQVTTPGDFHALRESAGKLTLHGITPPNTPLPQALHGTRTNLLAAVQRALIH